MTPMLEKFRMQDDQYDYPYHHIPSVLPDGTPVKARQLYWGMEYLFYIGEVCAVIGRLAPRSLLDVGCGDGYLISRLRGIVPERCGVDLSARAIHFAKGFNPDADIRLDSAANVEGQFDVVTAIEVLEHIPDAEMQGFVRTLCDRTAPGGHILITVPSTAMPLYDKHYRHYTAASLQAHFAFLGDEVECLWAKSLVRHRDRWLNAYKRLTGNRLWLLDAPALNRMMWRRLQKQATRGDEGKTVMALFRKRH